MNIIITGAYGHLGTHLSEALKEYNPYCISHKVYDLRRYSDISNLFKHTGKPDIIFHCAASVGGIEYNLKNPATIFYDNVIMNTELIRQAALHACGKFVFVSSVCAYPLVSPIPTTEESLWQGRIEPSNESYGMSKLIAMSQLEYYKVQYGLNFSTPILANLYGPGDGGFFNLEKAHLIPNLIRQFYDNTSSKINMFGNGKLTRDLLYIGDAVNALVKFIDIDYGEPVNIATGIEVSIREIVDIIAELTNFQGEVVWLETPDKGEQRRCYDISRATRYLNWQPQTNIKDGLKETWEWYLATK